MATTWQTPTSDEVLGEFTPTELASITTLMGGAPLDNTSIIGQILTRTIAEIRGYIRSGAYPLDLSVTTSLPLELFTDAVAITRWRFLISAPAFRQLQTPERQKSYEDAMAKLKLISSQDFAVEPPGGDVTPNRAGMWNSENKLIMRTHPIPRPATQFTPVINTYGNPDAPDDLLNTIDAGLLIVGTIYRIVSYVTGDDFTNVGGTNTTNSSFTATGTTPAIWTNLSQLQPQS